MKIFTKITQVTLLIFLLAACSSTKNSSSDVKNSYSLELGDIAEDKVENLFNYLTQRYNFEISRKDNYSSTTGFYAETFWKEREPFDDEKELGISKVQVKVILTSKVARGKTGEFSASAVSYEVDSEVIQQVLKVGSSDFVPFTYTDKGKDYVKNLSYELRDYVRGTLLR
ncbi:MAG: hypothetical protein RIC57_07880 [Balneola sp.]|jgi:hypothetical protein